MSNITLRSDNIPALQMEESELLSVLKSSLYPGASDASVKMVLGYCRATGLDPMMKPVHIVPMWDKHTKQLRDVIMPGIGKYRTDAARTGELVGIDEPEFGPIIEIYGTRAPEWCKVTVKRLVGGVARDFVAKEFWIENYAVAGKDTDAPNTMWRKRPHGQLSKCAEAQALRKGFPEATGSGPTAEEMEGRDIEIDEETGEVTGRKPTVNMPQAKATVVGTKGVEQNIAQTKSNAMDDKAHNDTNVTDVEPKQKPINTGELASQGEIAYILKKLQAKKVSIPDARNLVGLDAAETLDGLTKDGFIALKDALL